MKIVLITLAVVLTGCTSMDHFVCYGAGTCDRNGQYSNGSYAGNSAAWVNTGPQTVITNNGTYLIGRSQTTGSINSVIQTSRGK